MFNWNVTLPGPSDTPFVGGKFVFNIDMTTVNYPFTLPKVKFVTKIWHPQVKTADGTICTLPLEEDWKPTQNLIYIINFAQSLLA